jgi:hypothetical protein
MACLGLLLIAWGCGEKDSRKRPDKRADYLLINEVFTGEPDYIEIFNPLQVEPGQPPGQNTLSLIGYRIELYDDGSLVDTYVFVDDVKLPENSVLVLREGTGTDNPPQEVYLGFDLQWVAGFPVEVVLRDETADPLDYVAVNTSGLTPNLPSAAEFEGDLTQGQDEDEVIRIGVVDTDRDRDFRTGVGRGSPGLLNPEQGGSVRITTTSLPDAYAGFDYDFHLQAEGGTPPYRWDIIVGSLPAGFDLDPDSGRLTGITGATQTSSFTVRVRDSYGPPRTGSAQFTLDLFLSFEGTDPVILLNEISTEEEAFVEIFHVPGSGGYANLSGWTVRFIEDPSYVTDFVLPDPTIVPEGEALVIRDGYDPDGKGYLHVGFDIPWNTPERGACTLLDATGGGMDYLNWNDPFAPHKPLDINWLDTIQAAGANLVLWRNTLADTDSPADWSLASPGSGTPGSRNPGQ